MFRRAIGPSLTDHSDLFVSDFQTHPGVFGSRRPNIDKSFRDMLNLFRHATLGRNSDFYNMTHTDRNALGGLEYRSLRLLVKIVFCTSSFREYLSMSLICAAYFFGLHLFGAICLVTWIQHADSKYKNVLSQAGQNMNWWCV